MKAHPFFSFIIPVKDSSVSIDTILEPLAPFLDGPAKADIHIVDDGSRRPIQTNLRKTHIYRFEQSQGPAVARNFGAKVSTGKILCFLDADILIEKAVISDLLRRFSEEPHQAICYIYGENIPHHNFFSQYKNLWMRYTYLIQPTKAPLFLSSFAAIHRALFEQIGGFAPDYRKPSIEDTDFGSRLAVGGQLVTLVKTPEITHLKHYNWHSLLATDFLRAKALLKWKLRHFTCSKGLTNSSSIPYSHLLSLIVFTLGMLFGIAQFITLQITLGAVLLSLTVMISALLQYRFIIWVTKRRGIVFGLNVLAINPIENFIVMLGIFLGMMQYIVGKRY